MALIEKITTEGGEVYTATYHEPMNGWYIDRNGTDHVFIPRKKVFQYLGVEYFVSDTHNAARYGKMMIDEDEAAFVAFEKNHPELNP